MNIKKIVLFTVILMIAISSLSMVSANMKVTTEGISFFIPDQYEETMKDISSEHSKEIKYTNGHDTIRIAVSDTKLEDAYGNIPNVKKTSMGGHEGYKLSVGNDTIRFAYQENGKLVQIDANNEQTIEYIMSGN